MNEHADVGAQGGGRHNSSAQNMGGQRMNEQGMGEQRSSRSFSDRDRNQTYGQNARRGNDRDMRDRDQGRRAFNDRDKDRGMRDRDQGGRAFNDRDNDSGMRDRDVRGRNTERYGRMSTDRDRDAYLGGRSRDESREGFDRSGRFERGHEHGEFRGREYGERGYSERGGNIRLSDAQRTRIRERFIDTRSAPRIGHVGFDVRVGTAIPRGHVRFLPLPETLVELDPRWRGYEYFVYEDEIVVVDPDDMTIVSIIPT